MRVRAAAAAQRLFSTAAAPARRRLQLPMGFELSPPFRPSRLALAPGVHVVGLDVNTNSTGWVVLDGAGAFVRCGVISTHDRTSHAVVYGQTLADALRTDILPLSSSWVVGVEQYLKTFAGARTTSASLFGLAQVNGVATYLAWDVLRPRALPFMVHPNRTRGRYGIVKPTGKRGAKKGAIKEATLAFVRARLEGESVDWPAEQAAQYDVADAYLVACATLEEALVASLVEDEYEFAKFCGAFERSLELHYASVTTEPRVYDEGEMRRLYAERFVRKAVQAELLSGAGEDGIS